MLVFDVRDPFVPRRIGHFDCGGAGVHRIVWTGGRYAHASVTPEGFADRIWMVIDMSDSERPVEAVRFVLDEPEPAGARGTRHITRSLTAMWPTSATATPGWSSSTSRTSSGRASSAG